MRIVSKVKDYYDYLQGIYGIDEKVCYDRRDGIIVDPTRGYMEGGLDYWFKPDYKPYCVYRRDDGAPAIFGLEIGYVRYVLSVFRGINYDKFEYKLIEKIRINKEDKVSSAPINLLHMRRKNRFWDKGNHEYVPFLERGKSSYFRNPILARTFIPGLIPAEEVWENVYEYLSSLNEVEIIDTRTDVQHAESHGFDKKISFRHRKS